MKYYKAMLWKAYFDKGYSTTNYAKYLIAFFGMASQDVKTTMVIGIIYAFSCLIIGRLWFHFKLVDAENEVQNVVNPFMVEVRKKLIVEPNIEKYKKD